MTVTTNLTDTQMLLFRAYYDLADELSDPTARLNDFRRALRRDARVFADAAGLTYPPRLSEAEEFYLANRGDLDSVLYA